MSTHSLRLFSRNPGLAAQRSRLSDGGEAARPGGGQSRAICFWTQLTPKPSRRHDSKNHQDRRRTRCRSGSYR